MHNLEDNYDPDSVFGYAEILSPDKRHARIVLEDDTKRRLRLIAHDFPLHASEQTKAVVLLRTSERAIVGSADPKNGALGFKVAKILGLQIFDIEFWHITDQQYGELKTLIYGDTGRQTQAREAAPTIDWGEVGGDVGGQLPALGLDTDSFEEDELPSDGPSTLISLSDQVTELKELPGKILSEAYQFNVSDVFLEMGDEIGRICYRRDGLVKTRVTNIPRPIMRQLINIVAHSAGKSGHLLDRGIVDATLPIKLSTPKGVISAEYRCCFTPTRRRGVDLAIRNNVEEVRELGQIGFEKHPLAAALMALHKPQGLILLLAPTGEGKSVTREAMLRTLERRDSLKIIEFGNPIEFPSNLRTQIELDNDRVTWADASLAALRSNPNVITPSEFRDETEAEWVIKAASTGHLVITTFHATNIAAAFNRLMHLNIRPHDLAEHLTAMISQRLVRVLCPYCSVADGAAQELGYAKALTSPADLEPGRNRLPATWQHLDPRQSGGSVLSNWEAVRNDDGQVLCPHCGDEGYRGRTAILEVMYVTPSVQELILEMDHRSGWSSGRPSSVTGTQIFDRALSEARSQGIHLITLAEAAAKKVEQGITSLSEINRVLGCSPLAFLENPERSESETPDSQLESYETGKGAPYVKTTAVSN